MSQIVTDESKGSVFIFPVFGEVVLAASGGSHTIKNRGGHRFQFGRLCADHVDRNSRRLGKFSDVLRWYYAGIVRAVREHHYDFPTFILSRVFQRQQERVVECRLISGHSRAQGPQKLRPVGSKGGCAGKIADEAPSEEYLANGPDGAAGESCSASSPRLRAGRSPSAKVAAFSTIPT